MNVRITASRVELERVARIAGVDLDELCAYLRGAFEVVGDRAFDAITHARTTRDDVAMSTIWGEVVAE